MKTFKGSLS